MVFDLKIEEQKAQPMLCIRMKTSMEKLPAAIGEGYTRIMKYLEELGVQAQYAPYTAYYNLDMNDLDVEMGFPVGEIFPDKDGIKAGQIPPGKVVSCLYKGAYAEMEEPYKEIMKWIEESGHVPTGVYYEYYFNSPQEVPESELLTRIVIPLK
ncbi:MAG: GyrI-like domain-containing protein [Syntrophomonas sp.]